MSQRTSILAFLSTVALCAPATAQTVLFHEDFENGLGNWFATGLWNAEASTDPCGAQQAPFPSGTGAVYWSGDDTCDFFLHGCTPPICFGWDSLTLASPISLPADGPRATLRFRFVLQLEAPDGYQCWQNVQVRANGQLLYEFCHVWFQHAPYFGWHEFAWDLTPFLGQDVVLEFRAALQDAFGSGYGWLIDDVRVELEAGIASCDRPCPCGNTSGHVGYDRLAGCENSHGRGGLLSGFGTPSVSQDSLVLVASDLPPTTTALFFQGTLGSSAFLADGLRCAGGTIVRLAAGQAVGGTLQIPGPASPGIALLGQLPPQGDRRVYQAFYRDNGSFCTPATFNLTNAYVVHWTP